MARMHTENFVCTAVEAQILTWIVVFHVDLSVFTEFSEEYIT
jgi:hypothetical protein